MIKTKAILLTLTLALILSACSPIPQPENDKTPVASQNTAPSKNTLPQETEVTLAEQVIFEQSGIRVTALGLDTDGFFGTGIKVRIENDSSQNITVQTRNCSVNDLMLDPMFSCDVAAGKKANDTILFMDTQLEAARISTIAETEFVLSIFNSDTWEDILTSDIIPLQTSAADYVQAYDDSGFVAYDNGGIKIVIQKANSEDSFWGADVYVFAQNDTDANITIQARDVSINGYMVDPMFSCNIAAGKKAYSSLTFLESDLTENGITDIKNLELRFTAFNSDTWDDIFNTDIVSVTFE